MALETNLLLGRNRKGFFCLFVFWSLLLVLVVVGKVEKMTWRRRKEREPLRGEGRLWVSG